MQGVDGPLAGAEPGKPVRYRVAGHGGGLPGRAGQGKAGGQAAASAAEWVHPAPWVAATG